jgi:hypothetical protein
MKHLVWNVPACFENMKKLWFPWQRAMAFRVVLWKWWSYIIRTYSPIFKEQWLSYWRTSLITGKALVTFLIGAQYWLLRHKLSRVHSFFNFVEWWRPHLWTSRERPYNWISLGFHSSTMGWCFRLVWPSCTSNNEASSCLCFKTD